MLHIVEFLKKTFKYFYKPSECFDLEDKNNVASKFGLRIITKNMTGLGKVHPENHLPEFDFFDVTKTKGP